MFENIWHMIVIKESNDVKSSCTHTHTPYTHMCQPICLFIHSQCDSVGLCTMANILCTNRWCTNFPKKKKTSKNWNEVNVFICQYQNCGSFLSIYWLKGLTAKSHNINRFALFMLSCTWMIIWRNHDSNLNVIFHFIFVFLYRKEIYIFRNSPFYRVNNSQPSTDNPCYVDNAIEVEHSDGRVSVVGRYLGRGTLSIHRGDGLTTAVLYGVIDWNLLCQVAKMHKIFQIVWNRFGYHDRVR